MPGKNEIKINVRENVWIRLQELKGCGSWSDAIEKSLDLNEVYSQELIKLKEQVKNHAQSKNNSVLR